MEQKTNASRLYQKGFLPMLIAITIASLVGFLFAKYAPRGPITTSQVLTTLASGLMVGLMCGVIAQNRWIYLAAPAFFWTFFEISRFGTSGPTVDTFNLRSTYGIIAFILGRLIPFLLTVIPMLVGIRYGLWLKARASETFSIKFSVINWVVTIIATVVVILVAYLFARKPVTAPILGANDEALPNSVAEIISIEIGGHDQSLMIRGRNMDNPVILFLAGGPGGTEIGTMRNDVSLEENFIVATWDQRGVGKSYSSLDPVETLTLDQMISDTLEVTNYLRQRFNEEKIYLVGNSWGTLLGVLSVQKNPELFHAFIGAGQMVSVRETDIIFYEDTLEWAQKTGGEGLVSELISNGPPPYSNLLHYEAAVGHEHDWNPYPYLNMRLEMPSNLFVPENILADQINGLRGFLDTFSVLYPQIQEVDFRDDVKEFPIPFYMALGKYEARGRAELAVEWFNLVEAPTKELIVFEKSGHRTLFEEPGKFAKLMNQVVLETHYTD
jgi:proline iminopeptidase